MSLGNLTAFLTCLSLLLLPLPGFAQTVRGQVRRGLYPIAGVPVNVFSQTLGYSGLSYSGPDGMYYLNGIPSGPYSLQVFDFGASNPPQIFPIWVYPQPMTDIPPIQLR
jgi:hypothetical protein